MVLLNRMKNLDKGGAYVWYLYRELYIEKEMFYARIKRAPGIARGTIAKSRQNRNVPNGQYTTTSVP